MSSFSFFNVSDSNITENYESSSDETEEREEGESENLTWTTPEGSGVPKTKEEYIDAWQEINSSQSLGMTDLLIADNPEDLTNDFRFEEKEVSIDSETKPMDIQTKLDVHETGNIRQIQPLATVKESLAMSSAKPSCLERNDWTPLITKYKRNESWLRPLPWDPNMNFPVGDYYIDLDMDVYDRKYLRTKQGTLLSLFDPMPENASSPLRVLVQGDTGSGKSTLCVKTTYDWSIEKTTFRELNWETTLPVLITRQHLRLTANQVQDHQIDLAELLQENIFAHIMSLYMPAVTREELRSILQGLGRNLLIILDGYDELDEQEKKSFKSLLFCNPIFGCASFLVTSRPSEDTEFLQLFDKNYFIRQMPEERIEQLVATFEKNISSATTSQNTSVNIEVSTSYPITAVIEKRLQTYTGKEVKLSGMSPLMVTLICWLTKHPVISQETTDLLYDCVMLLCERSNKREDFGFSEKEIEEGLWRFGALLLTSGAQLVVDEWSLRLILGEKFNNLLTLTGILKYNTSEDLWEPVQKSFLETLQERIIDNRWPGSLLINEIKQLPSVLWLTLTIRIGKKGVVMTEMREFYGKRYFLSHNHQSDKIVIGHQIAKITLPMYALTFEIFPRETDVIRLCQSVPRFKCHHQRLTDFFMMACRYRRDFIIQYVFEDDNEAAFEDILCAYKELQIWRFSQKLSFTVYATKDDTLNQVCSEAVKRLFSFPQENRPKNESQIDYLRDAIVYIQMANRDFDVIIYQWFKVTDTWDRVEFSALSAERFHARDKASKCKSINFYSEPNGQWSMLPEDETFARNYTWHDFKQIAVEMYYLNA